MNRVDNNKMRVAAYMDKPLVDWLDSKVKKGRFRSRSHGIEESVTIMRQHLEGKLLR